MLSKEDFEEIREFLTRPEIWSQKGAAQIMLMLRYFEWTKDPPTVEGWYWVHTKYQENFQEKTKVVLLYLNSEAVFQYDPDYVDFFPDEENFIHYLGPLPIPEAPKE